MGSTRTRIFDVMEMLPPRYNGTFSRSRWPYTYASDLIRQHPMIVPEELRTLYTKSFDVPDKMIYNLSRAHAGALRQLWAEREDRSDEELACVLAYACCLHYDIDMPLDVVVTLYDMGCHNQ